MNLKGIFITTTHIYIIYIYIYIYIYDKYRLLFLRRSTFPLSFKSRPVLSISVHLPTSGSLVGTGKLFLTLTVFPVILGLICNRNYPRHFSDHVHILISGFSRLSLKKNEAGNQIII